MYLSQPTTKYPINVQANKHGSCEPYEDKHLINPKYVHNSLFNPHFCVKAELSRQKTKNKQEPRKKFTIIGNMVKKEFVYCTFVAKELYRYRSKDYQKPEIRYLTSVEWPSVLKNIQLKFGMITYCLKSDVVVYLNESLLGGEPEFRKYVNENYNFYPVLDYEKLGISNFINYIKKSKRPCVHMQITIENVHIGDMIFQLYSDIAPKTTENFLRLCNTKRGGYSGTPIHRIVKDGWIQCGGYGLHDVNLGCENFVVGHDRRGLLCMTNNGRNLECSTQFFVLLQPAPWMDSKYVAFGELIDGEKTLKTIENVPTFYESPEKKIIIAKTAVLNTECQDIKVSKIIREYIENHIEDMVEVRQMIMDFIFDSFCKELDALITEDVQTDVPLTTTKRFRLKKDHTQQKEESSSASSVTSARYYDENEEDYHSMMLESTTTTEETVPPVELRYFPLTSVEYPDDVESSSDLKKFLKGSYCLTTDLEAAPSVQPKYTRDESVIRYVAKDPMAEFAFFGEDNSLTSSEEETKMKKEFRPFADFLSFGGTVINSIAEKCPIKEPKIITSVRSLPRCNSSESSEHICETNSYHYGLNDHTGRVRIKSVLRHHDEIERRKLGSQKGTMLLENDSDEEEMDMRKSIRIPLLDERIRIEGPTLKNYMPRCQSKANMKILTTNVLVREEIAKHARSKPVLQSRIDQVLSSMYGTKFTRKISTDYAGTLMMEPTYIKGSLAAYNNMKRRTTISVAQYQAKNANLCKCMNGCTCANATK